LTVVLESDASLVGRPQTVTAGAESVRVPPGGKAQLIVPLQAEGGTCTTRFAVTPSAVPAGSDTRRLGVHFTRIVFRG
jgi:hypothetical protein